MMKQKTAGLILGPSLFLMLSAWGWIVVPEYIQQLLMFGMLSWMLIWWITQALPIGVTSLLPMVGFPLLGIMNLKATMANYANPIIYLFFGGFVLGIAIERWNLHKRIALHILRYSDENPGRIVLGSMLATAFLSMWISNTATTVMMLPIGISVVKLLGNQITTQRANTHFGLTVMLGIAYAANLGGMSTLIGTPPNLVLASLLSEQTERSIGFAEWFYFAFPLAALLFLIGYQLLTRWMFRVKVKKVSGAKQLIQQQLTELGTLSKTELRVILIVLLTAALWMFRAQLAELEGLKNLSDPIIAVGAAIVLFTVPTEKKEKQRRILVWNDMQRMPWGILLLFGGGISLAKGLEQTELINLVGTWMNSLGMTSLLLLIGLITLLAVFLTEVMSNVALVSVFIPVSFVMAAAFGVTDEMLAIPLTLGASCAFMFPISTPPNAIVFSSGYVGMNQMAKAGIVLNIISIVWITLYCYWLLPVFF